MWFKRRCHFIRTRTIYYINYTRYVYRCIDLYFHHLHEDILNQSFIKLKYILQKKKKKFNSTNIFLVSDRRYQIKIVAPVNEGFKGHMIIPEEGVSNREY
jgi:hypothetical protein